MYLYLELWMPRRAWLELEEDDRRRVVAELGGDGARFLRLIRNDGQLTYPSGCAYLAVWELPDEEQLAALEGVLHTAWHDYFGEVNARGTGDPPVEALEAVGWRTSGNGKHP